MHAFQQLPWELDQPEHPPPSPPASPSASTSYFAVQWSAAPRKALYIPIPRNYEASDLAISHSGTQTQRVDTGAALQLSHCKATSTNTTHQTTAVPQYVLLPRMLVACSWHHHFIYKLPHLEHSLPHAQRLCRQSPAGQKITPLWICTSDS